MDKKTMSRLKEIKRRSFFSTLFKSAAALFIMKSFPFKIFRFGEKRSRSIKIEMNPMSVKRNRRG